MKNVDTLSACKGCRKPLDGSAPADIPSPPAGRVGAAAEKNKPPAAGPAAENFDDLVQSDLTEGGADASMAEQVEVVRESEDEPAEAQGIPAGYKQGTVHINVKTIDGDERKTLLSKNFQHNILPRLMQIFAGVLFLAAIAVGAVIYSIMDLPEYYNKFHMRSETAKSFIETIAHLTVAENARDASKDPKIRNSMQRNQMANQYEDIAASYLNKYFRWMVYAEKFETIPGKKNLVMLAAKTRATDNSVQYIRMNLNDEMVRRIPREGLSKYNRTSVTVKGRIIGWKRSADKASIEIEAYDSELE